MSDEEAVAPQKAAPVVKGVISDDAWDAASAEFINDYIRNSPVSQDAAAWSHVMSVFGHFRTILEKHL